MLSEPDAADRAAAAALARQLAGAVPFVPMIIRVREDVAAALPDALPIADDAPVEQLIARVASALRLRTLHATVLGRAQTLKDERNIVAELPAGDPLDDATVLLIGRGRHHPTLSVAVGERMGVMGALSVDQGARCLNAREIDGIVIGDGLAAGSVDAFLTLLAEDARFRDLPVAVLGAGRDAEKLPNFVRARDPLVLLERAVPLIRLRAFETALKRLLKSIECKGMIDAQTGLFNANAFGQALAPCHRGCRASAACGCRSPASRSTSRSTAAPAWTRRAWSAGSSATSISPAGRTTARSCSRSATPICATPTWRRAGSPACSSTPCCGPTASGRSVSPAVTLATLKPADTMLTLLARVAPRPVAAA